MSIAKANKRKYRNTASSMTLLVSGKDGEDIPQGCVVHETVVF